MSAAHPAAASTIPAPASLELSVPTGAGRAGLSRRSTRAESSRLSPKNEVASGDGAGAPPMRAIRTRAAARHSDRLRVPFYCFVVGGPLRKARPIALDRAEAVKTRQHRPAPAAAAAASDCPVSPGAPLHAAVRPPAGPPATRSSPDSKSPHATRIRPPARIAASALPESRPAGMIPPKSNTAPTVHNCAHAAPNALRRALREPSRSSITRLPESLPSNTPRRLLPH